MKTRPTLSQQNLDSQLEQPDRAWGTDITDIPMRRGFPYLVAVLDLFSRACLAWNVSNSLDVEFCRVALERSLHRGARAGELPLWPEVPVHLQRVHQALGYRTAYRVYTQVPDVQPVLRSLRNGRIWSRPDHPKED